MAYVQHPPVCGAPTRAGLGVRTAAAIHRTLIYGSSLLAPKLAAMSGPTITGAARLGGPICAPCRPVCGAVLPPPMPVTTRASGGRYRVETYTTTRTGSRRYRATMAQSAIQIHGHRNAARVTALAIVTDRDGSRSCAGCSPRCRSSAMCCRTAAPDGVTPRSPPWLTVTAGRSPGCGGSGCGRAGHWRLQSRHHCGLDAPGVSSPSRSSRGQHQLS